MARFDGKYEIIQTLMERRELGLTLLDVEDASHNRLQIVSMDIQDSSGRDLFHRYRALLKATDTPLLVDVVARPGAYYSVWKQHVGQPLDRYLKLLRKRRSTNATIRSIVEPLSLAGFLVEEAKIIVDDDQAYLALLWPIRVPVDEAKQRNAQILSRLDQGVLGLNQPKKVRQKPKLNAWQRALATVPGLLFWTATAFLGYTTVDTYLNPETQWVPSVLGMADREAAFKLRDTGFRVSLIDGIEPGKAVGSVISQEPSPESPLHLGRLVQLTVNRPPPLTVPKVSELTLEAAKTILLESGFRLGTIGYTYTGSLRLPKGEIVSQSPDTGSKAPRGSVVHLLISQGVRPQMTFLPDLTGIPFEEARNWIKQAGLVLVAATPVDSDQPEGTILWQRPKPFETVRMGEAVRVQVAQIPRSEPPPVGNVLPLGRVTPYPTPPVQPDPEPTPESSGMRDLSFVYTFAQDLPLGMTELKVLDETGEKSLFKQSDLAGISVQVDVQVVGKATFTVLVDDQIYTTFDR